jgi:3-deoxy-7-phosphoheptulonate synthase
MIVVLQTGTPVDEVTRISQELSETWGVTIEKSIGQHKIVLGIIGDTSTIELW